MFSSISVEVFYLLNIWIPFLVEKNPYYPDLFLQTIDNFCDYFITISPSHVLHKVKAVHAAKRTVKEAYYYLRVYQLDDTLNLAY